MEQILGLYLGYIGKEIASLILKTNNDEILSVVDRVVHPHANSSPWIIGVFAVIVAIASFFFGWEKFLQKKLNLESANRIFFPAMANASLSLGLSLCHSYNNFLSHQDDMVPQLL